MTFLYCVHLLCQGASGIGLGNFLEIGPLDNFLKPRNSTWLNKADLLFVDNPVGTGFSYVEDNNLVVKTDEEAATDLVTLLIEIFNPNVTLQKSPVYIVGQSYGGKFAVTLALSALKAIDSGRLKLKLGGVALGDSWISPEDFVFSWGPLLRDLSRLDNNGLEEANRIAVMIKQQLANGEYEEATNSWGDLEDVISIHSNGVDFYNFLLDVNGGSSASLLSSKSAVVRHSRHLRSAPADRDGSLYSLLNGEIKRKLKIIPDNVTWGGQGDLVFDGLVKDFMKPRINVVDQLLAKGVNVTIYNGQLDVICATKGVQAWVEKLKWEGLNDFLRKDRIPFYCGVGGPTKGFTKSYKNLHFYWILGAGHSVPADQPCAALDMVSNITQSAIVSSANHNGR